MGGRNWSDGLFPLTPALSPEAVHSPQVLCSLPQSRRDCVLQPRVASSELPWVNCVGRCQPQRGCGLRCPLNRRNPVGVGRARLPFPRVARRSQPWALSRNPVGIRPPDSSSCGECTAPEEREHRGPAFEQNRRASLAKTLPTWLPLLRGEGRGEGEWTTPFQVASKMSYCSASRATHLASWKNLRCSYACSPCC